MTDFKPMLAAKANPDKLKFPMFVQPKLDGIRACVVGGQLLTRTLKQVPNRHIFEALSKKEFEGFDGELIVGPATAPDAFRTTTSAVMRRDGEPDFTYHVFDLHNSKQPYVDRLRLLEDLVGNAQQRFASVLDIRLVFTINASNYENLADYEAHFIDEGYEGAILRAPDGLYKYGRGSVTKGDLLKLKRFEDSEAEIIGVEEEMHNANEAKTNALGRTERSTAKDGLVGKGTLGALIVRDLYSGVEFKIGTGFDAAQRADYWTWHMGASDPKTTHLYNSPLIGCIVKYRYFATGVKDKPRFPVFLGFRDERDL